MLCIYFENKLSSLFDVLHNQLDRYVSFRPDPYSYAFDAFTLDWRKYDFYIFPPFSLVLRVLNKIQVDCAEGVCVVPDWPTQPWYSKIKKLMKVPPIILKPSKHLLTLPSQPERYIHFIQSFNFWCVSYQQKTRNLQLVPRNPGISFSIMASQYPLAIQAISMPLGNLLFRKLNTTSTT